MGRTTNILDHVSISRILFKSCHLHTNCLQMLFCFHTEDLKSFFTKITTHCKGRRISRSRTHGYGSYWGDWWGPGHYKAGRFRCMIHYIWITLSRQLCCLCSNITTKLSKLTEKFLTYLDLNLTAQSGLQSFDILIAIFAQRGALL